MMGFDSPDHHHHHTCEELLVDCGYTKVIASRVGAVGSSIVRAAKPGDFNRAKREKPPRDSTSYIPRFPSGNLREFTLKELQKATWNFSRERVIGRGGFGTVFRGILSDGAMVAVKVLDKDSGQGLEQFQVETSASCTVLSLAHPNLVPAIGFHASCKRKMVKVMIVYPFMANGDVSLYLGRQPSRTPLDWPTRKRIALGVARGICNLHELGIVHRDIKPANVMLDEDFNARVGDLGLAKSMDLPLNSYNALWFHGDVDSHLWDTTLVYGTPGYMAPELFIYGRSSVKSDVFAFGVTLIQLVTGNPAIDRSEEDRSKFLVDRAEQLFKNKENLTRHMHPWMLGMYDESEAIELIQLGLICTQRDPRKRPLVPEVITIMEGNSATLKQRWDNYDYPWSAQQMSSDNQSKTDSDISSHSTRFSYVGADRSKSGDEEVRGALKFDIKEEEPKENGYDGNQSRLVDDFAPEPEESNKEHRAGLTCSTNSRSLENDGLDEIVEVDLNEGGNPEQLSSQDNRHEGPSDEVATKLREVLDQMRAMEEMHQKQIVMMQTMIKMQEQCIQKVNEMQTQIDQLKDASQNTKTTPPSP